VKNCDASQSMSAHSCMKESDSRKVQQAPLLRFRKQSVAEKIPHIFRAKCARLACCTSPRGKSLMVKRQPFGSDHYKSHENSICLCMERMMLYSCSAALLIVPGWIHEVHHAYSHPSSTMVHLSSPVSPDMLGAERTARKILPQPRLCFA
jgi:hypothetical protein